MLWIAALLLAQEAELLRNGGFDEAREGAPAEWKAVAPAEFQKAVTLSSDEAVSRSGRSALVRNANPRNRAPTGFVQSCGGEALRRMRGRDVELSGWMRTRDATLADVWVQCLDAVEREVAVIRPHAYGSAWGTTDWTRFVARGRVPEGAASVVVRCFVRGLGEAWFDDVSLRVAKEIAAAPEPEAPEEHVRFRRAASSYVLGTDRDAVRAFAAWTPERVQEALAGGLGPPPWAAGYKRFGDYEAWIPREAKWEARPALVVVSRDREAHKAWVELGARDLFVLRVDPDRAGAALLDACARLPVDSDRVYTTSPAFAAAHADRVAGVAALGEATPEGAPAGLAWWIASPRPEPAAEALRKAGAEVVMREHAEALPADCAIDRGPALEWLMKRPRKARARGNVVTLTATAGSKVSLWFGPRDVEFGERVKVVANGKTAFEGALVPSFETFLERIAATADARSTAWAGVTIEVE